MHWEPVCCREYAVCDALSSTATYRDFRFEQASQGGQEQNIQHVNEWVESLESD